MLYGLVSTHTYRHSVNSSTHIQDGVNEDINTVLFRGRHSLQELLFSAPSSRNSAFLIKLSEIPLVK